MSEKDLTEIMENEPRDLFTLPDGIGKKMYYSMSEVCRITDLKDTILRHWDKEFPQLRPKRNRSGNRVYKDKDIELIFQIKHLLYSEGYKIQGAKRKLAEERREERQGKSREKTDMPELETVETSEDRPTQAQHTSLESPSDLIQSIRDELREILTMLT